MVWDEKHECHRPSRESILQTSYLGDRDMVSRPTVEFSRRERDNETSKKPPISRAKRSAATTCYAVRASGNQVRGTKPRSTALRSFFHPTCPKGSTPPSSQPATSIAAACAAA